MGKFTILFMLLFVSGISIFGQKSISLSSNINSDDAWKLIASDPISDVDGNTYKTVVIGYQTWMTENLKTTKFSDGTPIANVTDNLVWIDLSSPAYCWYNNNISLKPVYGALYNSYTITKNLCPTGWKVPTDTDWEELADYLQGKQVAGGKMKEKGTEHWQDPNVDATNSSGFSARPGGGRSYYNGDFQSLGTTGQWWANTVHSDEPEYTISRIIYNSDHNLTLGAALHNNGLSVRCVKERPDTFPLINLKRGLIGYYPFNGNTNDESGNGHNITAKGATLTTDRFGNPNSAYAFTGKKNSISFSGYQLSGPASTITSWIKPTNKSTDIIFDITTPQTFKMLLRVVNKHYQLELIIGGNKIIMPDNSGKTNIDPARPRFDFVGLRYNEEVIQFVVNHHVVSEYWMPINELNFHFPISVKKNPVFTFKGIFDDLRIYNRSLSEKEFATLGNDRPKVPPVVTADSVTNVGRDVASINSTINYKNDGSEILETGVYYSTSPNPGSSDNKLINCCTADEIVINLTGLTPNTTYYAKVYAIDTIGIGYSNVIKFTTSPALVFGSVTDVDGNTYKTIKIGTQTWMAENLKTTKYADGTPIENGTLLDYAQGKYYFIYENDSNYKKTYGLLYTWMAATNGENGDNYPDGIQGACPVGWHIPNIAEKKTLLDYLGGPEIAGGKLRETGYSHWDDSNTGTTNESGFSALGAGVRFLEDNGTGYYYFRNISTIFWSSETIPYGDDISAWVMYLSTGSVEISSNSVQAGASVRCIKNENSSEYQRLDDIDEFVKGSPTAIQETLQQQVKIYPNPAKNVLYIGNLPDNTSVSINSLQGKKLLQTQIMDGKIDISSLKAGVYFVHIGDGMNVIIRKIIKQ